MPDSPFVTKAEFMKHLQAEWQVVHNVWPMIKDYVPGYGYTKAEVNAFFEGYDGGKAQVHWSRITNKPSTFTPAAHASAHMSAGGDPIRLDELKVPTDVTTLDATTGQHGLMMKYPGGTTTYLRADGTWVAPPPANHDIITAHTASGLTIGYVIRASGSTTFAWAQLSHADLASLHQDVTTTANPLFGSVTATIHMAYGVSASPDAIYRLKPYDTADESYVKYLDKDGNEEWSVGTPSHQASWTVRRESGTPGNMLVVDRTDGRLLTAHVDTSKVTIGSFYIDTLIANNKVDDSAKLGGTAASSYALITRALDTFGATTDITTLNATTSKHGLLMKLGGGTANFLRADGAWAAPTPAGHASSHEIGGGDLVDHDNLTNFVANKHIDWTNSTQNLLAGSVTASIFQAFGLVGSPDALYRLKPYGTSDESFVKYLDNTGSEEWSVGTQSHQAGFVIRRESGTPANLLVVQRASGIVNIGVELDTPKLTIGSYYLNSLIANNKVPDADTVDSEHATDIVTNARVKAHFPDTIANVLSDHNKAAHDALNIDADTLDSISSAGFLATAYLSGRSIEDCNDADVAGVTAYYAGATNKPPGTDHALLTLSYSNSWSFQLAGDWRTSNLYVRKQENTSWGTWYKVWSEGNHGSGSGLDADTLDTIHASSFSQTGHTHAWADVSKTGSNLTDLATRQHAGLSDAPEDAHHPKLHVSTHAVGQPDALSIGTPSNIGTSNSAGTQVNFVRRDHVHAHPSGLGTGLHHAKSHASLHVSGQADQVNHNTLLNYVAAKHLTLPAAFTSVINSGHTKAIHTTLGLMPYSGGTFTGAVYHNNALYARSHGTAALDEVVNVCYGTGGAPAASSTTEGALYIRYTA